MVSEVTDASFKSFVASKKPVLVDFYATWCGPCKMLSPIVEQIAAENTERLAVGKMDVDANPQTTQQYGIMSMPTMLVFQGGQVVKQLVGYRPKNQLLQELADVL